jgi:hypothetical protein
MGALLHNFAPAEHNNVVCFPYGAEAMCNDQSCSVFRHLVQGGLDHLLATHVDAAGGLVEDQDLGPLDNASRNG